MLKKRDLEVLFYKLGEELNKRGELVDITIYGGSALLLKYGLRDETKDVDACFDKWDAHTLESLTRKIANDYKLDEHWLNNDAEIFKADKEDLEIYKKYPDFGNGGLRVSVPKPEYMLALQVQRLSTMTEEEYRSGKSKSLIDIENLMRMLDFDNKKTINNFIEFYPKSFFSKSVIQWLNEKSGPTHSQEINNDTLE